MGAIAHWSLAARQVFAGPFAAKAAEHCPLRIGTDFHTISEFH
jgi:hypothetical protein